MQLVRTAQPKHKINLLSLSTEAGGPDVGHLVCSINSMQFVRTAQFKHKHLLALYSHSPRRTGGPQAPASGALVLYNSCLSCVACSGAYYVGCLLFVCFFCDFVCVLCFLLIATMSFADYFFLVRPRLSAFSLLTSERIPGLVWFGLVYLVTTAGFVVDQ